jgi:Kef-type K+ transport system membrane component KefB
MHLPTLLLQIGVIVIAARAVGLLFGKLRQPQVMGEMVAGILLGPSLLGAIAPGASALLFPPDSLTYLNSLSQIGLVMFMFLVGLELNPALLRSQGKAAVVTSHVSIIMPLFLGTLLAVFLYPRLSDDSVTFSHFALFIGTVMSVTAFPVLARILAERNLIRTTVGTVSIASAAVGDVTAWCILAGIVLLVRASEVATPLWLTLFGSAVYVCFMVFVVRRPLNRLAARYRKSGGVTRDMLAVTLLLVLASAWVTEWLGIHALFGAFLVGAIMPKDQGLVDSLAGKIEDVTVVLLLPLFFAFTGLRTSIGFISGVDMWLYCALITFVAIAGKLGGAAIAAKMTGLPWREAGAIGILMNTRGLMELVVLNIGLDIGVISPALFTIMVLMALITTFMASPLLDVVYLKRMKESEPAALAAGMAA